MIWKRFLKVILLSLLFLIPLTREAYPRRLTIISPEGAFPLDRNTVFEWTDIGAEAYQVIVSGPSAGNRKWVINPQELGGTSTRFEISLDSILALPVGFVLDWQVEAITPSGRVLITPLTRVIRKGQYRAMTQTPNQEARVSAFNEISRLRRQDPIPSDQIESVYLNQLQSIVQRRDSQFQLNMDADILQALQNLKNNVEPRLAGQVIDKTLQRAFFLTVLHELNQVRDNFSDKRISDEGGAFHFLDEAWTYFQAIKGTVAREERVLSPDRKGIEIGPDPLLDEIVESALVNAQKSIETDGFTLYLTQREIIRLSIVRAFHIAVLREVDGVLDKRANDPSGAGENQVEGEVFYRTIEEFIARDNPEGNAFIKAQLTGPLADVNADRIVAELSKGFLGRVKGELKANEESLASDPRRAKVTAEEARLYSEIFISDLEDRLGKGVADGLRVTLDSLIKATHAQDFSIADASRRKVENFLQNYELTLTASKSFQLPLGQEWVLQERL